jgi:glucosamine 6-phosphate synthetase-like amidotransferase/phosphosugar isomerase protein
VEYDSDSGKGDPIIKQGDIVIAISQAVNADTLAAVKWQGERAKVLGICNVVDQHTSRK